ncbi:MAG TPA: UPF0182 family protein [Acidimicrobiales bacterium]|nr:UPF0182 family protein [Acidimicrobiales bacterium]
MRTFGDRPRRAGRRLSRTRIGLIVLVLVVIVGLFSLRGIAGFYTDYLWFASVHLTSVWRGVVWTKVVLALLFTALFFVAMWTSLAIADRVAPTARSAGPEDEFVQRYRDAIGPHAGRVRTVVALVFALLVGTGASGQWNKWLLYRNGGTFGINEPQFHRDLGFFVFRLPFYSWLVSWAFLSIVVITIITIVAHYMNGGIRLQAPHNRVSPQVKAHISLLLGALALLKAVGYYLQRFELDFSTRGVVNGATYTDVHAQLPALTLLILISLVAFVLFIYNIRLQGWVMPIIGVGLWAFVSLIVGAVYPAFIQKFRVQPAENAFERPYLQRNMTATRTAYGLDHVQVTNYAYTPDVTATDLTRDPQTVRNIRLWDPTFAVPAYQKLQEIRSYYQFNDLGIDRYNLGGAETQTLIAVRQLNPTDLPAQSWVNVHLQYTHGYGAVLSPANASTADGSPSFVIQNIPPTSSPGAPTITQPAVYFGLNMSGYVIADSRQPELDYQRPDGSNVSSTYRGQGGVQLGSLFRRAAFALRFGDINPLISGQVTSDSRVIYYRDLQQRVSKAAPFLQLDSDPYAAIVDGRIVWIQDAYTTTRNYPYSQLANVPSLPQNSGLNVDFNYIRNSVKVVVDAYDGSMRFYVMDPTDPIIKAYEKAFPRLFTPASDMSLGLRAHLRYPEDLFRTQVTTYGRYHIQKVNDFYAAANAWNISQNAGEGPPDAALQATQTTNAQGFPVSSTLTRMDPQYLLMRLPGSPNPNFLILDAFVPVSQGDKQQNLTAFMVGQSDPSDYGQLQVYIMPPGQLIDGPALIDARIAANPTISEQISLLNQQGSQVELGNVLVIPIQKSLLYIRPLYVQSARNPLPQLQKVIVVSGTQVAMADTLQASLAAIFGTAPPTLEQKQGGVPTTPSAPTSGTPSNVAQLLAQAAQAYAAAQQDLANGNLGAYQTDVNKMGQLISQAEGGSGSSASPSTTTSTTSPTGST